MYRIEMNEQNIIPAEDLAKWKRLMRRGDMGRLTAITGKCRASIYNALAGQPCNYKTKLALYVFFKDRQNELKQELDQD